MVIVNITIVGESGYILRDRRYRSKVAVSLNKFSLGPRQRLIRRCQCNRRTYRPSWTRGTPPWHKHLYRVHEYFSSWLHLETCWTWFSCQSRFAQYFQNCWRCLHDSFVWLTAICIPFPAFSLACVSMFVRVCTCVCVCDPSSRKRSWKRIRYMPMIYINCSSN